MKSLTIQIAFFAVLACAKPSHSVTPANPATEVCVVALREALGPAYNLRVPPSKAEERAAIARFVATAIILVPMKFIPIPSGMEHQERLAKLDLSMRAEGFEPREYAANKLVEELKKQGHKVERKFIPAPPPGVDVPPPEFSANTRRVFEVDAEISLYGPNEGPVNPTVRLIVVPIRVETGYLRDPIRIAIGTAPYLTKTERLSDPPPVSIANSVALFAEPTPIIANAKAMTDKLVQEIIVRLKRSGEFSDMDCAARTEIGK